jgi:CheY-like chemotaxis protein
MTAKILYIEDNDQNFYLVSYILEKKGYTVLRARDGREGIDCAKQENPGLILLDIQLPVMNGYETAQELRTIPGVREIPIIAVTSYAMAGDRERALAAGCTGYIEKPINPRTFAETIGHYLPAETRGGDSP